MEEGKSQEIGPAKEFFLEALVETIYDGTTGAIFLLIAAVAIFTGYYLHSSGWSAFAAIAVGLVMWIVMFAVLLTALLVMAYRLLSKPKAKTEKA